MGEQQLTMVQKVEKIVRGAPQVQTVERIVEVPQIRTVVLPAAEPAVEPLAAGATAVRA